MSIDPEDLLSALRRAQGKGLSLKQLAGELHLGQSQRHRLRRALADLMKHGRASYDAGSGAKIVRFLCLHGGVERGPLFVYALAD